MSNQQDTGDMKSVLQSKSSHVYRW